MAQEADVGGAARALSCEAGRVAGYQHLMCGRDLLAAWKRVISSIAIALAVLMLGGFASEVSAQSKLKQCPTNVSQVWNNCFGKHKLDNGAIYDGEWRNNKPHGQGTFTYPNGSKYVGEFKDGKFNGQGTFTHFDGSKYVGSFKDHKINGQGTFTNTDDGSKYVGEFKDDNFSGQGTYTYGDGSKYVGEFRDSTFNGRGVRYAQDGSIIEQGIFENDKLVKADTIVKRQASKVDQPQKSKLPPCPKDQNARYHNCFGTYKWLHGDQYVGEWKDNEKHGQGTFTLANGNKYVGEWKGNKLHGRGVRYAADGSIYEQGIYENDKLVKAETIGGQSQTAAGRPQSQQQTAVKITEAVVEEQIAQVQPTQRNNSAVVSNATRGQVALVKVLTWAAIFFAIWWFWRRRKRVQQEDERQRRELVLRRDADHVLAQRSLINFVSSEISKFARGDIYLFNSLARYLVSITEPLIPLFSLNIQSAYVPRDLQDQLLEIKQFTENHEDIRRELNPRYIENELVNASDFFDQIEKNPLTDEQRRAVLVNEDCNLVVASAGSGKTSVIVAKVAHLLQRLSQPADEVLMLAFNKHAAEEMKERLEKRVGVPIDVSTFHALGYKILGEVEEGRPPLSKTAGDDQQHQILIRKIITELMSSNDEFDELMRAWFQSYFAPYKSEWDFKSKGEYYRYLRDNNLRTLKGELVRSFEECEIANWLVLNGIEYEYEASYEHDTSSAFRRQYQPDFYLPELGIYIEHFGINERGEPAPFINRKEYLAGMQWKRETHEEYGTVLIETYSYEKARGTLLEDLRAKLEEALGQELELEPISITDALEQLKEQGRVDDFSKLMSMFLRHFKSSQMTWAELTSKEAVVSDARAEAFVSVFAWVLEAYQEKLEEAGEIDFEDMIARATEYVEQGHYPSPYTYILVDEFQDISAGRAKLLKALLAQDDLNQLFCVGDDWQAIFRFAGSDIAIMKEFASEFGVTGRSVLGHTFRSNDKITEVASQFVLRNPAQIEKSVDAIQKIQTPCVHIGYPGLGENHDLLHETLSLIDEAAGDDGASVLLLGRYRHCRPENLSQLRAWFPSLKLDFKTVHGAKGLEADYVVVLDLKDQRLGFPTGMVDDPLINLVLAKPDGFPHAEERRLFYVALTRARHGVFLLADKFAPSPFVTELENDSYEVSYFGSTALVHQKCPTCKEGHLTLRQGKFGTFAGCSFYPLCDHTEAVCPSCEAGLLRRQAGQFVCTNSDCEEVRETCTKCEKGWMVERQRKNGSGRFLACIRYPECDYAKNLGEPNTDEAPLSNG
jgi:DNA helicase-4